MADDNWMSGLVPLLPVVRYSGDFEGAAGLRGFALGKLGWLRTSGIMNQPQQVLRMDLDNGAEIVFHKLHNQEFVDIYYPVQEVEEQDERFVLSQTYIWVHLNDKIIVWDAKTNTPLAIPALEIAVEDWPLDAASNIDRLETWWEGLSDIGMTDEAPGVYLVGGEFRQLTSLEPNNVSGVQTFVTTLGGVTGSMHYHDFEEEWVCYQRYPAGYPISEDPGFCDCDEPHPTGMGFRTWTDALLHEGPYTFLGGYTNQHFCYCSTYGIGGRDQWCTTDSQTGKVTGVNNYWNRQCTLVLVNEGDPNNGDGREGTTQGSHSHKKGKDPIAWTFRDNKHYVVLWDERSSNQQGHYLTYFTEDLSENFYVTDVSQETADTHYVESSHHGVLLGPMRRTHSLSRVGHSSSMPPLVTSTSANWTGALDTPTHKGMGYQAKATSVFALFAYINFWSADDDLAFFIQGQDLSDTYAREDDGFPAGFDPFDMPRLTDLENYIVDTMTADLPKRWFYSDRSHPTGGDRTPFDIRLRSEPLQDGEGNLIPVLPAD